MSAPKSPSAIPTQARILVVDGDDSGRRAVRAILEAAGFSVDECGSAAAARSACEAATPEVVLVDMALPGAAGFELCQALRGRPGGEQLPIVALTNRDDDASIERAFDCGASDFVTKPIAGAILVHRLRYLLRAARWIRDLRDAEGRLARLAYYDNLTGLPNRTLLREQLAHTIAEGQRYGRTAAVLAIDLDLFKRVNESLGHDAGDVLLRQVAERLRGILRGSDSVGRATEGGDDERTGDTLARLGGDEFVVVLSQIGQPLDASVVAQRILKMLGQPFAVGATEMFVTGSVGIATFPQDGGDVDTLLRHADMAMNAAKENGRSSFRFFQSEINERVSKRIAIERGIRLGIDRNEFLLHYQPRINLRTGHVESVEALVRWRHPDRGLVSPAEFIPVAEESGLIVPLGAWVMRAALGQAKTWLASGLRMPVAVNVSARQFREPDLAGEIRRAVGDAEIDPSMLEVEITEGVVMQDTGASARALEELHRAGVRIALDDFGTGYSSLSYLSRFPIDTLKVDRSFVQNVLTSKSSATITAGIIALSRSLGLQVTAEGIETEEQLEFLKREGCDEGQGFLFAKPMPADDLVAWLAKRASLAHRPVAVANV